MAKSPWLMGALSVAANTAPGTIAPLPTLDRLAEQIRAATNELVGAQAEHDRIEIAKANEMREFDAALATSKDHQTDIERRLRELQTRMADQVRALGIKAEVVG